MTEPLPCPFCGHVGVTHNEGSTFRWLTTECNGCGAQCGEERINTMTMERSAAIEQAKEAAIKTWNTRAALEQQAEPSQWRDMVVVSLVREGIDKHKARELADHFAAQQQAEPPPEWLLVKNILDVFGLDAIAFVVAWKAAQQQAEPVAQRPWVGLTDEERDEICLGDESVARSIETKLREKNGGNHES